VSVIGLLAVDADHKKRIELLLLLLLLLLSSNVLILKVEVP
jgi:hypothetical protein